MQNLKGIRELKVVLPPKSLVRRSCKKILVRNTSHRSNLVLGSFHFRVDLNSN
jgi:hypothetical protein